MNCDLWIDRGQDAVVAVHSGGREWEGRDLATRVVGCGGA